MYRLTFCVLVTQSTLAHIRQLDCALGAGIHEPVAADGVKFSCSDDFCELFHVGRLDVDNVEALVLDVQVPEVDSQVIATDESLSVTIH